MDDLNRVPPSNCMKIFIHRDFSEGTAVKFVTKFPQELDGKIEPSVYGQTLSTLNAMFAEAERCGGKTYCESCFACMTAYMYYLCLNTSYEKTLRRISRYIEDQNQTVYVPRGLMLVDPVERGLRVLEICVFHEGNR